MARLPIPRAALTLAFLIAASAVPAVGQVTGATLSGEFGTSGELYTVSGREPRRPGSLGRLFFNPTFALGRHFNVSLDLQFSNEGSDFGTDAGSGTFNSARQRLNQLGISPGWGWGKAHLGDFTDSYTPLTFSGVRVRGAGANINPGLLRFAAFGGNAKQAVIGGTTNGSYARDLVGGRIGIGREDASFFDLMMVRAVDDPNSLPPASDTAFVDPRLIDDPTIDQDTLPVGTLVNPFAVTPQENLVLGVAGRLVAFDRKFRVEAELTGSAYSRDVRASELESEEVLAGYPGILRSLFTPRLGSNVGLAYTAEAEVRLQGFTGSVGHRYIDPGYAALGVGSVLNDQRQWEVAATRQFGRPLAVRVDGSLQSDNLLGQKAFTTRRTRLGSSVTLRPSKKWTGTVRVHRLGMGNSLSGDDARRIAYHNWIAGATQNYLVSRDRLIRTVGLGYNFRTSGDANPARQASNRTSHQANVRVVFVPRDVLSLTPTVGLVWTHTVAEGWRSRATYGLAAQLRALAGRWTTAGAISRSQDRDINVLDGRLNSRFTVTPANVLTFSLRGSKYRNAPDPFGSQGDFTELTMQLGWTHSFNLSGGR